MWQSHSHTTVTGWFYLCFIYYSETVFYDLSPLKNNSSIGTGFASPGPSQWHECQSLEKDRAELKYLLYLEEANVGPIPSTGNSICCCRCSSSWAGAAVEGGRKEHLTSDMVGRKLGICWWAWRRQTPTAETDTPTPPPFSSQQRGIDVFRAWFILLQHRSLKLGREIVP